MKMKQILTLFILAAFCTSALLSGCTPKQGSPALSAVELADKLANEIEFVDELKEIGGAILANFYLIEESDIVQFKMYKSSSGGTAEEIAVFEAANEAALENIKKAVSMRLEDLKIAFEDYVPAEMTKINNAVVIEKGLVIAVAVCDTPEDARRIIESSL